jgi:hypothetical protein
MAEPLPNVQILFYFPPGDSFSYTFQFSRNTCMVKRYFNNLPLLDSRCIGMMISIAQFGCLVKTAIKIKRNIQGNFYLHAIPEIFFLDVD